MNELYKKVSKGIYSPIPTTYTKSLSKVIANLLKKNPAHRPTADEILTSVLVKQKLELYIDKFCKKTEEQDSLLETIRYPNSGKLKQIINKLPKSNYIDFLSDSSKKSKRDLNNSNLGFPRNANTMIASSINSSIVLDHNANSRSKYLAKSIKPYRSETRRRSQQKESPYNRNLSHRDYGNIVNEYSGSRPKDYLDSNSKDKRRHKRAESSLLKLKKLKADRASLEKYIEDNNTGKMPKIVTGITFY
jgi:serine/threonine protein kinase